MGASLGDRGRGLRPYNLWAPGPQNPEICRLRKKLSGATSAVRSLFGAVESQDETVAKLEQLQQRIRLVKTLFRDQRVCGCEGVNVCGVGRKERGEMGEEGRGGRCEG